MVASAGASVRGLASSALALTLLLVAASAVAQPRLRRDAPIQHVALAEGGTIFAGAGFGYYENARFPLVGVDGDLLRLTHLHLVYAPANGILVEIKGDVLRQLQVDRFGTAAVQPNESLQDGRTTGSGSYRIGTLLELFRPSNGPSLGVHLEYSIPSADEAAGLGTNTTDVRVAGLLGIGRGTVHFTGELGLEILEAPLVNFAQNDVLVYAAELLVQVPRAPVRLYGGVSGRASTRGVVPLGTEDLGEIHLGLDYSLGPWTLDGRGVVGYTENSPAWGLAGGLAYQLDS